MSSTPVAEWPRRMFGNFSPPWRRIECSVRIEAGVPTPGKEPYERLPGHHRAQLEIGHSLFGPFPADIHLQPRLLVLLQLPHRPEGAEHPASLRGPAEDR